MPLTEKGGAMLRGTKLYAESKPQSCTIGIFEYNGEKWMLDGWINPGTVLK